MIAKRRGLLILTQILLAAWLWTGQAQPAAAQLGGDFFEEEDFFEEDDPFRDEDEFGLPQEDFTEGGEFIDESTLPPSEQGLIGGRQRELRLLGERELLPLNAAWGAGTGLIIGGWFALINQGTSRETQRSLGLGVVVGTVIGLLVGARTLVAPDSPTAAAPVEFSSSGDHDSLAATSLGSLPFQMTYTLRF